MATTKGPTLPLKEIVIDPTVLIRRLDKDTVARYKEASNLPPVIVYEVTRHEPTQKDLQRTVKIKVLADGLHRWTAAKERKDKVISVDVRPGTIDQAREFAILANLKHGKPLKAAELAEAIRRMKQLNPKLDTRSLGEIFNVSHMTAARALKPTKRGGGGGRVPNQAPTTVPTGPKAAKSPSDVLQAVLTVLQVLSDPTVSLNLVTYVAGATPKEVQERTVANFDTGGSMLQQLAARIQEQVKRKPNDGATKH